jgi:hypothetical protein
MAEYYRELTIDGVKVNTYTDTVTGSIKVYSKEFGAFGSNLLAESIPKDGSTKWNIVNGDDYRRLINNELDKKGEELKTETTFTQDFYNKTAHKLNNERAGILNSKSSMLETEGHIIQRIPGVTGRQGSMSGLTVNSDGTLPFEPTIRKTATPDEQTGDGLSGDGVVQIPVIPPAGDGNGNSGTGDGENGNGGTGNGGNGNGGNGNGNNTTENADDTQGETSSTYVDPNAAALATSQKTGGENEILSYPVIKPPSGMTYDYIQITAYEYSPSDLGSSFNRATSAVTEGGLVKKYETIQLPMQPSLSESNAVSWTNDTINDIQRGFANLSSGVQKFMGTDDKDAITTAIGDGAAQIRGLLASDTTRKRIVAFFAGQAVGANLMQRATGSIINPNLELMFTGPGLRSFNFTFRLTPREQKESEVIRKIIRAFKRNSSVQKDTVSAFLKSPRIFKLEYIYKEGGQHPYLNKFKPCALTNFAVNYTPDGSYMVFNDTGSLTAYDIQLSFTEIVPVYADDYNGPATDMGF